MLSKSRLDELEEFQEKVGISFNNVELLNSAFSHSSYVNEVNLEKVSDNEKLEYLGDSVLALIVNEYIYKNYPEKSEGELSKIKSIVVSEYSLARIARSIDLGKYLLLGKGEQQYGGSDRDAILADTIEAVLGAYYLDRGLHLAEEFILKYITKELRKINKDDYKKDYKTELQLLVQQKYKSCPIYETKREEGPDHNKVFYVEVLIEGQPFGIGKGSNKKNAQQESARIALEKLTKND